MTKEQMEQIVLANMQKIYLYCVRRIGNAADAEDVASDITVELLGSYGRLKDDNAVMGYVWAVADTLCKSYWRKAEKQVTAEISEKDYLQLMEKLSDEIGETASLVAKVRDKAADTLAGRVSPEYKDAREIGGIVSMWSLLEYAASTVLETGYLTKGSEEQTLTTFYFRT